MHYYAFLKFYRHFIAIINICIYNVHYVYRLQITNSDYVNMFNALYLSIGSVIGIGLYLLPIGAPLLDKNTNKQIKIFT